MNEKLGSAVACGLVLIIGMNIGARARADEPAVGARGYGTLAELERDYDRQLSAIARKRLNDLINLARRVKGAEADDVHRALFHTAVAQGWFEQAGPVAKRYFDSNAGSSDVRALAALVSAVDGVEQGQVEPALETLGVWLRARHPGDTADVLGASEVLTRRLIHAAHYDAARRVCRLLAEQGGAEIGSHFKTRLRSLDLVGNTAPDFEKQDIDGQPFKLRDQRGKVVLMVFWATWCPPCLESMARWNALEAKLGRRGLVIVGVNLDAHHTEVRDAKAADMAVRHALVEHSVSWPNLINQQGDGDMAKLYSIETVPASVLVGRDGKVIGVELDEARVEETVTRALGSGSAQ